ncbi:MAG: L,D-transpeptidase family protein [Pseudomonadota bacterium]
MSGAGAAAPAEAVPHARLGHDGGRHNGTDVSKRGQSTEGARWRGSLGRCDLVVGPWGARFLGQHLPCSIGRGGIVPLTEKREGDGATPAGIWRLTALYVRPDRLAAPPTCLPLRPLGPRTGWAEDPADPAYNGPVLHPHPFAADAMRRGDGLYDLCAVTNHNTDPVVPGAGSAIFVHVWRRPRYPTAGCVAFRRDDLIWILARWSVTARLVIRP